MNMRSAVLLICYLTAALGAPADLTAPDPPAEHTTPTLQQNTSPAAKTEAPPLTFSSLPKIVSDFFLKQQPGSILSEVLNNSSSSTIEGLVSQTEIPDLVASIVKQTGATDAGKIPWIPFLNGVIARKQI